MRQFQCVPTTYVFSINEFFTMFTISFFLKINSQPLSFIQRNEHVEMKTFHVVCHAPMSNFNGHLLFQADRLSCSYLNPPGGTNFTLPVLILSLSGRRSNHT